ncbi:hypothetical protein CTAYLR_008966 [Chrysophaeum taylorii]|uniref:PPIase cyclophilin-type domain-containing protein n=1 Tax=Chrysophaeum taylorii TaxID=2483200 RepID=A0AAD7XND2_9STRA|nr:hypothetical protein CTAYLR_008966 [Chrysophaeum taylorii]
MRVGIIGGGISGLAAGRGLVENHDVVVFDTGKRRVGGRCASRLPFETGWGGAVDHAAQFVKVSTPRFAAHVEEAVSRGVLRPYGAGSYVGTAELGISGFATDLASGLDVRGDAWIPPNGGLRGGWLVDGEPFDAVVIAHNGKCAERLGKRTSLGPLLRARFGRVDSKRLSLNSVYSLLFEVPAGTVDVDVRYVEDEVLAFLSNNNLKLGWEARYHVFTALSTGDFARRNKHPQEALQGTETETRVVEEMLRVVRLKLRPDAAPETVKFISRAVASGLYDGTSFYRSDFVIQCGIHGSTKTNPFGSLPVNETKLHAQLSNVRGTCAIAHFEGDNGSTEFFINISANQHLDDVWGGYCVFAEVADDDAMMVCSRISGDVKDHGAVAIHKATLVEE